MLLRYNDILSKPIPVNQRLNLMDNLVKHASTNDAARVSAWHTESIGSFLETFDSPSVADVPYLVSLAKRVGYATWSEK